MLAIALARSASIWRSRSVEHRLKKRLVSAEVAGARKAALPRLLAPQLATLSEDAPKTGDWLSEIKFDGYRMMARLADGEVSIYSRNNKSWTDRLPVLAKSLATLPAKQAWLDGEVVALEKTGRSSFSMLKGQLTGETSGALFFYVFDLLYLDGHDLTRCRQIDRKVLLAQLLAKPPPFVRYSEHHEGLPQRILEQACAMKLEGVICKRTDAPYQGGRNKNWLKLKCVQREEFVVVGYTDPQGSRKGFGALHLGYYDRKGNLHYAGGVGTGFSHAKLIEMHRQLQAIERKIGPRILVHGEGPPKGIHWVKPQLIAETQYLEWTGDGVLRHTTFLGLRDDKEAKDVVRDPPSRLEGTARPAPVSTVVTARKSAPR